MSEHVATLTAMRTLFAYLDAGSASAIVSMILGGVAALGVALRYRWNQILVAPQDPQAPRGAGAGARRSARRG